MLERGAQRVWERKGRHLTGLDDQPSFTHMLCRSMGEQANCAVLYSTASVRRVQCSIQIEISFGADSAARPPAPGRCNDSCAYCSVVRCCVVSACWKTLARSERPRATRVGDGRT